MNISKSNKKRQFNDISESEILDKITAGPDGENNKDKQNDKKDTEKKEDNEINTLEPINIKNIIESDKIDENPRKKFRITIKNPNKNINPSNEANLDNDVDPNNTPRIKYFCENKTNCDHKKYTNKWYETNKIPLEKIETIGDLIKLGSHYHCRMRKEYNGVDLKILLNITPNLIELETMIGLSNIKEEIVNMIIYLLLMKNSDKGLHSDMLHAVITGSPGCGKTTFIEIIAKIYTKLGVLKKGHIVKAKRSDLIGKYLGHTAVQTQNKINEAKGGILLIDEAYSLGNPEGRDSFSKECLDTLNQALSEDKSEFICIIAGYKNALDNSFFNYNEGLRRRFPFRFDISAYKAEELALIFMKKIKEYGYWKLEFNQEQLNKEIKTNFKYFENQGGDMETLFLNLKIVHNKRVFLLPIEEKKKLIIKDIGESINKFLKLKGDYFKNKHETPSSLYI